MEQYGKLFKKNIDNQIKLYLNSYNPDKEKYFEVIKRANKDGLRQVIINSEIMTKLMFLVIESKGLILKINLSDNADREIDDNIKAILPKLKTNGLLFVKLKEELEWAMDKGSIDINNIEVYCLGKKYQIFSNGIIYGDNIDDFFKQVIEPVLRKYFNGE